jgi:hypothetical protein
LRSNRECSLRSSCFSFIASAFKSESGNIFFVLFGAVALVGAVGAASMQVMKGPVRTMAEVTKRTVAENNMIASTKLVIIGSANAPSADCDGDGFIEPIEPEDPGAGSKPAGGGYLPSTVGAALNDPWNTRFALCAWDHGTNATKCGGTKPRLLTGGELDNQYAIAVISAGSDRIFQTACNDFVDANTDDIPDTSLLVKTPGTDDIVLGYTYAEANNIGGGLWTLKEGDNDKATLTKDIEVRTADDSAVAFGLDRTSGQAEFMAIKTDNIMAKSTNATIQFDNMFRVKKLTNMDPLTGGGDSLWTQDGSDIYYDDGGVNIGDSDLGAELLNILGTTNPSIWIGVPGSSNRGMMVGYGNGTDTGFIYAGEWGGTARPLSLGAGDVEAIRIKPGGDVGIGTSDPQALLHLSDIGGSPNIRFDTEASLDETYGSGGPSYASTGANDSAVGGSNSWTSASNATTSNNSKATRALTSGGGVSQYIKATGFGFAIPADAAIEGIKAEWEKMTSDTAASSSCRDNQVRLVKGGTITGSNLAQTGVDWSMADAFVSYGDVGEFWGTTWTPADINASTFGAAISALNSGATSRTCSVDSVRITVYYSVPDAPSAVSWMMAANSGENGAFTIGPSLADMRLYLGVGGGYGSMGGKRTFQWKPLAGT